MNAAEYLLAFIFLGAVLLAGFSQPLLHRAVAELTRAEPPARADVIALCGEAAPDVARQGFDLYHAGFADAFVLVGDAAARATFSHELEQAGVPASQTHAAAASADATQQAHALMLACREHGWKRVLLVTPSLQSRLMREAVWPSAQQHGIRVWSTPGAADASPPLATLLRALWEWWRYF